MLDKKEISRERAVLVGVNTRGTKDYSLQEYLDELEFLVQTAGGEVVRRFTQNLYAPDSRTYIGSGKLDEIRDFAVQEEVGLVVFDDELSPSQLRNIEHDLGLHVMDRTNLILDIFAQRARTAHARTQVELAQYEYLLPRLAGMWSHLERQRGGIGMRGPGEREIETDRRIARTRIAKLKEDLRAIDKQMATQRKNRATQVRVALVGYTNVGKSTIMNAITGSEVLAENKLFATLDTTVRKVHMDGVNFLLSDTVGFIRKLPTQLVESFKSTLDEVCEADILVHVVDLSHHMFEEQMVAVNETLREIGASGKPQLIVFNKIDAYSPVEREEYDLSPCPPEALTLEELENTWMGRDGAHTVFVSALRGQNMGGMRSLLTAMVRDVQSERYPWM